MTERVRYVDSITEGVSRWASRIAGRKTSVSRGSVLLVNLMGGVEHSGIYLGNACVAELYNDNGVGRVQSVPLWEFLYGRDGEGMRWGSCVYAACTNAEGQLASERVAAMAERFVRERRTVNYNLVRNNCHLFSMSCIKGRYQPEREILDLPSKGCVSIGELTQTISQWMNGGGQVVWRPAAAINEILGLNSSDLNVNVPMWTAGGEVFWEDLDHWNGWRLQKNVLLGNSRILDSANYRRAWAVGDDGERALRTMMERLRECERIYRGWKV